MQKTLDNYFLSKNLDVSFNTLGGTDTLVNLFVKENNDIIQNSDRKQSNYSKHRCYDRYYKIEPREKFTGFEKFTKLDNNLRLRMSNYVSGLSGVVETKLKESKYYFGSYLTELKNSFKKFNNPILYLSGGIDSEFVALAMLDAKVQFTPVIFQWIDDKETVHNLHDIVYALDFCNSHNLSPIIRKINIERLWTNPEFELIAKETNISSPQINTYVYMVESMSHEFKNSTHVLGGEIRFKTEYDVNENKFSNFVLAAKVPALEVGYNGLAYYNYQNVNYTTANTNNMGLSLRYAWDGDYANDQYWYITGYVNGSTSNTPTTISGSPIVTSGKWFNADPPGGGLGFSFSINNGATWTDLPVAGGTGTALITQALGATGDSDASDALINYTFKIRSNADLENVITTTFSFRNIYNYIPTLQTYLLGSSGTWTRPNSLITTVSVAVIGGGGGGGSARRADNGGGEKWSASGGGGAGGTFVKQDNIAISAITPTITYAAALGGAGGLSTGNNAGSNGGNSTITVKSTTGDVTLTGFGGGGGASNDTSPPENGQAGNGGSNASWSGGAKYVGGIDYTVGGGGAGSTGSGNDGSSVDGLGGAGPTSPGSPGEFMVYKSSAGSGQTGAGTGGDGGISNDAGSIVTGNGPAGADVGGGGGGAGVLATSGVGTVAASGGDGSYGAVLIYY